MSSADTDGNQQPGLIAFCVVMLTSAVASVALRCWSIWSSHTHRFGYDDAFAILTLPFIIAESSLIFYWISLGLGRHIATLPVSHQLAGPKIIFAAAFLYDASITFPKLSVLCFYHRIFQRGGGPWVRPTLAAVGALCVFWLIGSWLATAFQCTPVRASWEAVAGSKCVTQWKFFTGTAAPSAILDLIILLIPLPLLWSLHMTRAKKAMLIGLFICGYSVVVVSVGRLITLLKAGSALEADLTWTTIEYICWVQCEGPISLMSVCLPNITDLGRRWLARSGRTQPLRNSAFSLSSSASKPSNTADLLSGKRSFHPLGEVAEEVDREAILLDSGGPQRTPKDSRHHIYVNTTFEATRDSV
ncbi:hypothetical protein ASPACDRAFT_43563 [Aspergillus aculeatus ATCC 16872]|uniref:Rhodopsin domain-containing protein n=1 Tax=Aspergillus aculeatus (strain ATCC 16872 / CBS 172.66 / WB 5094) TaxID=690307 RepID=A0A1L9WUK1_ASPA1|nr:uncharacterized protein ASPACDRAFT_43563 [Aspergillus aculeatus ATCC 16872]OJJ99926.1 hypothetical protein ASPACDRAFT_43563 [Aspergillus aculeatus ATCC 16872]